MHRSRIGVILIDIPSQDFGSGLDFWSAATGRAAIPEPSGPYTSLGTLPGGLQFALQELGPNTPTRLHLDIETDDVTAEIARLRTLGATVDTHYETHAVLRDPAGLIFCVVPVQTEDFDEHATTWP